MKKILAMSVVCALAVALAAPAAFAQDPTRQGYPVTGQDPESLSAIEALPTADESDAPGPGAGDQGSNPGTEEAATAESLPFTGLDVGIVALLGAALLGTGIAVRRVARGSQT